VLRGILHPGGLKLTRRIAELAEITSSSKVLDVACGRGESSVFLANEFGCTLVGIDLSARMVMQAHAKCPLDSGRAVFFVADAEEAALRDNLFDAVLLECCFSVLPNKRKAAQEIFRVLKPKGRLVMADICRDPFSAASMRKSSNSIDFSLIPCVDGAMSIDEYLNIFVEQGLRQPHVENHSAYLKEVAFYVGYEFGGWDNFIQTVSKEILGHELPEGPGKRQYGDRGEVFCEWNLAFAVLTLRKPQV
jgi:arsenite methyltransferase